MKQCKEILEGNIHNECGKSECCYFCEDYGFCESKNRCELYDDVNEAIKECSEMVEVNEDTALDTFKNDAMVAMKQFADLTRAKKQMEVQIEKFKTEIESLMQLHGIKKFQNDFLTITHVDEVTKTSIDTAAVRKKYPEVAAECSKTSTTKAYVKITLKDEK